VKVTACRSSETGAPVFPVAKREKVIDVALRLQEFDAGRMPILKTWMGGEAVPH
jgi:hypothetical protein